MPRKKIDPIDAAVERAFYRTCNRITIPLLSIPTIHAAGRAAYLATGGDVAAIEDAITTAVNAVRVQ